MVTVTGMAGSAHTTSVLYTGRVLEMVSSDRFGFRPHGAMVWCAQVSGLQKKISICRFRIACVCGIVIVVLHVRKTVAPGIHILTVVSNGRENSQVYRYNVDYIHSVWDMTLYSLLVLLSTVAMCFLRPSMTTCPLQSAEMISTMALSSTPDFLYDNQVASEHQSLYIELLS